MPLLDFWETLHKKTQTPKQNQTLKIINKNGMPFLAAI